MEPRKIELVEPNVEIVIQKASELKNRCVVLQAKVANLEDILREKEQIISLRGQNIKEKTEKIADIITDSNIYEEFFKQKKVIEEKEAIIDDLLKRSRGTEEATEINVINNVQIAYLASDNGRLLRENLSLKELKDVAYRDLQLALNDKSTVMKEKEQDVATIEMLTTQVAERNALVTILEDKIKCLQRISEKHDNLQKEHLIALDLQSKLQTKLSELENQLIEKETKIQELENETRPLNEEEKEKLETSIKGRTFNSHFSYLLKAKKMINILSDLSMKFKVKYDSITNSSASFSLIIEDNKRLKEENKELKEKIENLLDGIDNENKEKIEFSNENIKIHFNKMLMSLKKCKNLIDFFRREREDLQNALSNKEKEVEIANLSRVVKELEVHVARKDEEVVTLTKIIERGSIERNAVKGSLSHFTVGGQATSQTENLLNSLVKAMKVINGLKKALEINVS